MRNERKESVRSVHWGEEKRGREKAEETFPVRRKEKATMLEKKLPVSRRGRSTEICWIDTGDRRKGGRYAG